MPEQLMGYIKRIIVYTVLVVPGILILLFGKTTYGDYLPLLVKEAFQDHFSIILSLYLLVLLFIFILYKYTGIFQFTYMQRDREKLKEKAEIRDMRLGVNRQ